MYCFGSFYVDCCFSGGFKECVIVAAVHWIVLLTAAWIVTVVADFCSVLLWQLFVLWFHWWLLALLLWQLFLRESVCLCVAAAAVWLTVWLTASSVAVVDTFWFVLLWQLFWLVAFVAFG